MGDDPPIWRRAYACLERGESDEARALLAARGCEGSEASPTARWAADLLAAVLAPSGTPAPSVPRPASVGIEDDPTDPGGETAAFALALHAVLESRSALPQGRLDDLVEWVDRAAHHVPDDALWLRASIASLYQAAFRFTGRADLRDRGIVLAERVADRVDRPSMAILGRGVLATIHLIAGRLHATLDRCDAAIDLAASTGFAEHPLAAMPHQFRGYVLFEWNRIAEARDELERAWILSRPRATGVRSGVARTLTAVCTALGDDEAADLWFGHLEEIVSEPMTLRNREWLAAVRIRHGTLRDRDLRAIDSWRQSYDYDSDALSNLDPAAIPARLHEYEHLLMVLEATRQWETILRISEILRDGSGATRPWFAVRAWMARAVALDGLGRRDEADTAVARALDLAQAEGYVRVFLDGSPVRVGLLRRALDDRATAAESQRVLDAARAADGDGPDPTALTPKQLQVIHLVAQGHSNREVATELGVAETTVRTHLREVYARLEVGSRTAAVAEARRRRLI